MTWEQPIPPLDEPMDDLTMHDKLCEVYDGIGINYMDDTLLSVIDALRKRLQNEKLNHADIDK